MHFVRQVQMIDQEDNFPKPVVANDVGHLPVAVIGQQDALVGTMGQEAVALQAMDHFRGRDGRHA